MGTQQIDAPVTENAEEKYSQRQYRDLTRESAVYPEGESTVYLTLGLNDEAGEVAGAVKKHLRGDYGSDEMKSRLKSEMGDVLWYFTRLLDEYDLTLEEIRNYNANKIERRMESDSIQGDGEGVDR
jgi:NTP pyrophosphatase (non-canonical NTP hydrolase)